ATCIVVHQYFSAVRLDREPLDVRPAATFLIDRAERVNTRFVNNHAEDRVRSATAIIEFAAEFRRVQEVDPLDHGGREAVITVYTHRDQPCWEIKITNE